MGFGMKPLQRSRLILLVLVIGVAFSPFGNDPLLADNAAAVGEPVENAKATFNSDTSKRLQESVRRLNAWINFKATDQQLRGRLLLNVLDTQAAKGENADLVELERLRERFESVTDADLAENVELSEVADALLRQIANLKGNQNLDIESGLSAARGNFHQISVAELMRQRDVMKRDLEGLIRFSRESMESKERAELFVKLGLAEAIEELDQIQFELPPANSATDINLKVRELNAELLKIERALDALPLAPEPGEGEDEIVDPKADERAALLKQQGVLSLEVAELKKEMAKARAKDQPRLKARAKTIGILNRLRMSFNALDETNGDPFFTSAAATTEKFAYSFAYGTSSLTRHEFDQRLAALVTDLADLSGSGSTEAEGRVGAGLEWMERSNQIPKLLIAIRAKYSKPNIYVSIGDGLINRLASRNVVESQPLCERIDGRLVRGQVTSDTLVTINFNEDPNQVHAEIQLTGGLSSATYIQQGKIRAYINTAGSVSGTRGIYANLGGFFAVDPTVDASVAACFNGTSSKLRVVDCIAEKKFAKEKCKSEASATRRAKSETLTRFTEQTDEAMSDGRERLNESRQKMRAKSNLVPEVYLRSFDNSVLATGEKSSLSRLGAPGLPVAIEDGSDVTVAIHDSMPNNYLATLFAGKTFSNEELADELGSILGEAPATLTGGSEGDKDDSFSITFAAIRPIQIEFRDNAFRIVVSGSGFSQGAKKIKEGLKIALKFKIVNRDGKLFLMRDGAAEIDYLEPEKKRPTTVAFRSFLDGKLNPKETEEELASELPANLVPVDTVEALQDSEVAAAMVLSRCRAEGGWLHLGWTHNESGDEVDFSEGTPAVWVSNQE
eukprot:COSAG01_NODE_5687_length_4101_cov_1.485507_2_plen_846_part_00